MRTIIQFIAFTVTIALLGCSNSKEIGSEQMEGPGDPLEVESKPVEDHQYIHGTLTTAYEMDGCPHLIHLQAPLEDGTEFLLPVGLDKKFLVNDMKLKFTYLPSRAPSGNCYIGMPAVLSNVSSL